MILPAILLGSLALAPLSPDSGSGPPDSGSDGAQRAGDRDPLAVGTIVGGSQEESERARRALERGLAWLASQQAEEPDGSFPPGRTSEPYPRVGVAAFGALAYMAAGNSTERGPYHEQLTAVIGYLVSRADLNIGSESFGYISDSSDTKSQNHGHGLATLALAQAYAMSPTRTPLGKRIETALVKAVSLIERIQGMEGAWEYPPKKVVQHEGSVTICLVQALRAARNVGVRIDTEVVVRALDYVKRTQKDDGSFRYALGRDDSTVALTAAAISTMNSLGEYSGNEIARGYEYIWRELTARDLARETNPNYAPNFPYYERFYLTQAMWQHADKAVFQRWIAGERRRVLDRQKSDGSWHDSRFGNAYATSVNCLFLALPDGLLPIFQR